MILPRNKQQRDQLAALALVTLGGSIYSLFSPFSYNALGVCLFCLGFLLLGLAYDYAQRAPQEFSGFVRRIGMLPRPTETYLFVLAFAFILLVFVSPSLASEIYELTFSNPRKIGDAIFYIGLITLGVFLSLYHAFSPRKKSSLHKTVMQMSTASLLGGVAVATAFHVYMAGERFYLVFAIWNGLQAIVLLLLSGKDGGGEFIPMPEKNAKRVHLFIAATITIVFVVYLTLVQEVYWSVVLGSLLSFWVVVESLLDKFTAGVDHRT